MDGIGPETKEQGHIRTKEISGNSDKRTFKMSTRKENTNGSLGVGFPNTEKYRKVSMLNFGNLWKLGS